jgi:hypothetical protein
MAKLMRVLVGAGLIAVLGSSALRVGELVTPTNLHADIQNDEPGYGGGNGGGGGSGGGCRPMSCIGIDRPTPRA